MDKVVVLLALFTSPNFNSLNVNFKTIWPLYILLHLVFHGLSNGVLQWLISGEVLKLWIISLINRANYEIS